MLGLEDDLIEAEIPDTYIIRYGSNQDTNCIGKSDKARNMSNANYMTSYDIFSKFLYPFETTGYMCLYECCCIY